MNTIYDTYLLFDDVQKNEEILNKNDSQLNRRNYLRSLISFYEYGLSFVREKTLGLLIEDANIKGKWNFLELVPLFDFTPNIGADGKLNDKLPNKFPFINLIKYTIKTLSQVIGLSTDIFSDGNWDDFIKSLRIRNRITHPKLNTDIIISDEELINIKKGWDWWNSSMKIVLDAYYEFLKTPKYFDLPENETEIDLLD